MPNTEKIRLRPILKNAYMEAHNQEKAFLVEFFQTHAEERNEKLCSTSSKWSKDPEENAKAIPLPKVIDHARESRLTRWILSWLPVPCLFYAGGRTYSLFKTKSGIDPRNERNRNIPSEEIAAKVIVRGR
jgi:hypothetical protein